MKEKEKIITKNWLIRICGALDMDASNSETEMAKDVYHKY